MIDFVSNKPHYENVPFEIPESWEWTQIKEISSSILYGVSESAKSRGRYKLLRITDIQDNKVNWDTVPYTDFDDKKATAYILQNNDILFARTGATVGKSYLVQNLSALSIYASYLIRIQVSKKILSQYIKYYFESGYYWEQISDSSLGIGQPNVNGTLLGGLNLPLPPLAEQQRIVAEVEKWFAVIDKLETNKEDLKEYIKQVKSKVLELAIHGKLVPQDPNDEPAIELLKRINPNFKPCDTSHYENLPNGWSVCKLCDIAKITAGGTPSRKIISFWDGGTIPWLKIADMTASGKYIRTASEYITEDGMKNSSAKLMRKGTLLYTIFASIGEVGILDFDATCNQAIANIDLHISEMTDYIYYYLRNLQAYMYSISKGCTQQNINQGILKSATIPLPPLAEQKRIAEQIETIFASLDTITAEL